MDKRRVDVSQCFLTFMALVGDVEKTAAALDMNPADVESLAKQEGWLDKIARVSLMSKGGGKGDWERAQNRALCFVQAQRLRMVIDAMMAKFHGLDGDEILDKLGNGLKPGVAVSAKFFSDVASAMEKVHFLSYAALGDTVREREGHEGDDDGKVNASSLHAAVIAALNNPSAKFVPSDILVAEAAASVKLPVTERLSPPEV